MDHASWAVAGWLICCRFPGYDGVVAAGAYRRWRRLRISSAVRFVMGCGAGGEWGGGVGVAYWLGCGVGAAVC
jgi:hypothetical protein